MNEPWPMRPHHGLCLNFFAGKGYSRIFVKNMADVITKLKLNPVQEIALQSGTDLLCKFCPHNINQTCETEQKVAEYDKKCLSLCTIHEGQILPWQEFQQLVRTKIILPGRLCEICTDCCWNSICQQGKVENSVQSVEKL